MKFLVTGCAGFIGSHLTEFLLNSGHKVIGIDSLNDYYSPKIKLKNIEQFLNNPNFSFFNEDFTKSPIYEKLGDSSTFDGVFHIGGYAGVRYSIKNPFLYIDSNITGPVHLFEWLKNNKKTKFVLASSSSIYGEQDKGPFKENSNSEDFPVSQYSASKRATEMFGYTYHRLFGLNMTFLRFFTVYGPKGRIDMAPMRFMIQNLNEIPINLYGDGKVVRDFTYISDIIEGIYKAFETTKGYDIINIGCGEPHSILELIENIEDVTGKKIKINFMNRELGDVNLTYADISKAKSKFNFKPKVSLKDGIRKTFQWYNELDEDAKTLYLNEINVKN